MKFVKFLLDAGGRVVIPAIPAPQSEFESARRGRAACTRFGAGYYPANLRSGCAGDGREELHRFELPSVVCQRAARGGLERRGAAQGDPAGRRQRAHGRGVPGSRNEVRNGPGITSRFPIGGCSARVSRPRRLGRVAGAECPRGGEGGWGRMPQGAGSRVAGAECPRQPLGTEQSGALLWCCCASTTGTQTRLAQTSQRGWLGQNAPVRRARRVETFIQTPGTHSGGSRSGTKSQVGVPSNHPAVDQRQSLAFATRPRRTGFMWMYSIIDIRVLGSQIFRSNPPPDCQNRRSVLLPRWRVIRESHAGAHCSK